MRKRMPTYCLGKAIKGRPWKTLIFKTVENLQHESVADKSISI